MLLSKGGCMYEHEIANARLADCLERNEKLLQHIRCFDDVVRAVCTELDMCYAGVDVDSGEIVAAIKKLKQSN